jgi:hypothetical protein
MRAVKWAVFFASWFLSISVLAQCTPGNQNGVTVVCDQIYSTHGSPLAGEPTLNYDLYYPTSYGPNNVLSIIVFWHGGGYRTLTDKETNGAAVFSALAAMGFDVYIPSYSLTAMGKLASSLCPTCWLIPLGMDYNNWSQYFPTGVSPNYTIQIDNEVIGPVYQQAWTGSRYNIWAQRKGVAHSTGAFVYLQGTQWPKPGNDGARFLAFLGRNAGEGTGVAGNPHDIRLWGFSAGGHLTLMLVMSGSSLTSAPDTTQIIYPNWGHTLDLFMYSGGKMSMQSQSVQAMVNFIR